MCWTSFGHHDVARDTTHCDTVWIQKLTVVFSTRTKVELEYTVTVKYLHVQSFICVLRCPTNKDVR